MIFNIMLIVFLKQHYHSFFCFSYIISVGSAACGRLFNDTVILEQYNDQVPCVAEGYFQYPINWHGYLVKATLPGDRVGRLYYHIVYPEDKCCIKLLLYTKRQVAELRAKTMSCLQRQAVLDPRERQVKPGVHILTPFLIF